jgi:putative membrane protein
VVAMMYGFGFGNGHGMGNFFGGGMLMMGLFWIVIIVAVVYFVRNSNNSIDRNGGRSFKEDPIEIARQRYAKGEISKEELQEIKEELRK